MSFSKPVRLAAASLAFAVLSLTALTAPAMAQSVRVLGDFRAWSAYATSDSAGMICFVLSKPVETTPEPDNYGQAYLYLTHRPAERIRNEFNLISGYTFGADSTAELTVGGETYQLFTSNDAAWLTDTSLAQDVAGQMRAGSTLTIEGENERGIKIRQTFSLSGVTAASRAIDSECY